MFTHPQLTLTQLKQRQSDLIAEADAYRLLAAARRARRERGASGPEGSGGGGPDRRPAVPSRSAGNRAACAPHAAVPAR